MQQLTRILLDKRGSKTFKILFCTYVPLLFTVTLLPGNIIAKETDGIFKFFKFGNADKVVHFVLFFTFAFLLFLSAYTRKNSLIWIIPVATGVLIEIIQQLMGMGRTFDLLDITANTIGAVLAYFVIVKKL